MGAIDTSYTFTATDVITSAKMNNILDQSTMTATAITGATLSVTGAGKLFVSSGGITSNEIGSNAVTTTAILDANVTPAKLSTGGPSWTGAGTLSAVAFSGPLTGNVTGNVTGNTSGSSGSCTGNSATATIWQTARNLTLTGDVTATLSSVNGSAAISSVATIANNAVTTAKILDANVTTAKILDGNITTAKILDGNVTPAKLSNSDFGAFTVASGVATLDSNVVTTAKILDANVTTAKILDANITTAKIADANVTTSKIADANVTTAKILDANVTTAKILDANITAPKLDGAQTGTAPIYGVRAWVDFDCTKNAAGAVDSLNTTRFLTSGANTNVASVTKTGSGKYNVVFTVNMPNATYAVIPAMTVADDGSEDYQRVPKIYSKTTAGFSIAFWTGGSGSSAANPVSGTFCVLA